jgi:glycosyltransferase involved in cell wall biosynthesis
MKRLSIIIPTYNELKTLPLILGKIEAVELQLEKEIIIVDDGSTDGTREWLKGRGDAYNVVLKEKNGGKGSSLKEGIQRATGDIVIFQDADLEYDPEDYPAMVQPILEGRTEMVLGVRIARDHALYKWKSPYYFMSWLGNSLITWTTNLLYWNNAGEYEGCYKAFTRKALGSIRIESDGFEIDNEIVCKLLKKGYKSVDAPIRYYPRSYAEGKHIRWSDGLKILLAIIKYRLPS